MTEVTRMRWLGYSRFVNQGNETSQRQGDALEGVYTQIGDQPTFDDEGA